MTTGSWPAGLSPRPCEDSGACPGRAVERRGEIVGQRRASRRPACRSNGCGEGQPRAWRNWRSRPSSAGRRRTRGRRTRDGRSPAGARGSGGCARSRAGRGAARSRAAPARARSACRASRGSSVSVDMSVRTRRSRPSGASIVPVRAGGRPSTSARYSRVTSRACDQASRSAPVGGLGARTTSRPEVSRSRRWTIPARPGSPPAARPASAWESVPGVAARRVDDDAGGLVDDEQVLVLVGHGEAARGRGVAAAARPRSRPRWPRPGAARGAWVAASPSTSTRPASICALRPGPRAERLGQNAIEPLARGLVGRAQLSHAGAGGGARARRAARARRR